jgi:hypothetical protein
MNKFIVYAYDDSKCDLRKDKETQEVYLHVPDEAYYEPVELQAIDFETAMRTYRIYNRFSTVAIIYNSDTDEHKVYDQ